MLLRLILYAAVGYFIFRVIQVAGRLRSSVKDGDAHDAPRPPEPHIPDYRDIKDADFTDLTPKDSEGKKPADT